MFENVVTLIYVTCSHQMSLNSQPAYCATGKKQSVGVYLGVLKKNQN